MFIAGFATEDEIVELMNRGWEVEDARKFGPVVGTADNSMMLPPEPSPSGTRAVAVFVDASLFDVMNSTDWENERALRDYTAVDTKERPTTISRPLELEHGNQHAGKMLLLQKGDSVETAEALPTCTCGLTQRGHPRYMAGSHEGFCAVSLRNRGLPWKPMNIHEWEAEDKRLRDEEERLLLEIRRIRAEHKFRCTHRNAAGEDIRQTVGGGETFCYTCRQQFD